MTRARVRATPSKRLTRERQRLDALRIHAARLYPHGRSASENPFHLLFNASGELARRAFARARGDFYGHERFQSVQPFAGRAIATAWAGRASEASERFGELGLLFVGGSIEGHALALHALLGEHDRLESVPPWPAEGEPLDADLRARLAARNELLRPSARAAADLRLALLAGLPVRKRLYQHDDVDPALAAEAALRAGDLLHARERFSKMTGWKASWWTAFQGVGDPRCLGELGLARVFRKQGILARAIKHCDAALALDPKQPAALLLGMDVAHRLGFRERALGYRSRLRRHHPYDDVAIDDLTRHEVEAALGLVDARRLAAEAGLAAIATGDFSTAIRALDRALGRSPSLEGRRRELASARLYALAQAGDLERLASLAEHALARDPCFINAREALAFALGKLGDRETGKRHYAATGLGDLFRIDERCTYAKWLRLPVARALSPRPASAEDRIASLIANGATRAALVVADTIEPVPHDAPIRASVAEAIWRQFADRPRQRRRAAARAWDWLAPLLTGRRSGEPPTLDASLLGVELLATLERWEDVLAVPIDPQARDYPLLTNRAYARIAPFRFEAMLALDRPQDVLAEAEHIFEHAEAERTNLAIARAVARARAALGQRADDLQSARAHPEDEAMALLTVGWAQDQRGEIEDAIESYLRAAETHIEYAGLALGNAGNLCTRRGDFARAEPFLRAALFCVSRFPPESRAFVLAQAGAWFRKQARHTDALPCAALAYELAPTAQRAALVAEDYAALGDRDRALRYLEHAERLEPRHPVIWRVRESMAAPTHGQRVG